MGHILRLYWYFSLLFLGLILAQLDYSLTKNDYLLTILNI